MRVKLRISSLHSKLHFHAELIAQQRMGNKSNQNSRLLYFSEISKNPMVRARQRYFF